MKYHLLRYLIPIILIAVTVLCDTETSSTTLSASQTLTLQSEIEAHHIDSFTFTSHSDFHLPLQISGANALHLQTTTKRTSNAHKNHFEFVKSGKAINASIKNFIQKKSLNIQYLFIKPAHRVIRLGKLII